MTTTQDLSTDHSRARADEAHSHGIEAEAPASSRAARTASFDVADFGEITGSEEEWRFSAVDLLEPVLADRPAATRMDWRSTPLPEGVRFYDIDNADARARAVRAPGDRASAIAVAHSDGATVFAVAPGTVVADPIEVTATGTGQDVRGQLLIEVGAGAEVTLVLDRVGQITLSEFISVDVAENASLNLVLLQRWDEDAIHAGEVVARLGRDARLRGTVVTLGGKVVRLNTSAAFAAEGGDIELFGLYFSDAGQHLEHQLFVDHAAPRCRSRVTYKGALQGKDARSVWIGDVLIRAEAEGTDTYELNRNLVLTEGARADSVPNLEIETGEIEGAGHASATGRFDDEQLFYLKARGIPEREARRLVVRGFFTDLIQQVRVPAIEERLVAAIERELEVTGA